MMKAKISFLAGSATTTLAALICLSWWFTYDPAVNVIMDLPGRDGRPLAAEQKAAEIRIGELFAATGEAAAPAAGAWPRFRGGDYDNISKEGIPLAETWGPQGPEVLWTIRLGEGHAGAAVLNDRVYLLDYADEQKQEILRCFSLASGRELWRRGYGIFTKRNHGVSRSVPAVTDKYVVTIGPRGHVMCTDAVNGDFLWGIDLVADYGATVPQWYTAQCPLIDGDTVVLAPAGSVLLCGVDLASGQQLWETPNPGGWLLSHSSIMPMTLQGKRMYVYSALGGVAGISAEPADRGRLLWQSTAWNNAVVAPSPVLLPDGRVFLTAGYGAGSMLLQVTESGGTYQARVVYSHSPKEGLACEQQTPVFYKGCLFGILPKDAGPDRTQFICYDPAGQVVWTSGKTRQFGLGPYLLADGKFYILNDDGELFMLRASTSGYEELGRFKILSGRDAWAPLVVTGGRMLLRDSLTMVCINLKIR